MRSAAILLLLASCSSDYSPFDPIEDPSASIHFEIPESARDVKFNGIYFQSSREALSFYDKRETIDKFVEQHAKGLPPVKAYKFTPLKISWWLKDKKIIDREYHYDAPDCNSLDVYIDDNVEMSRLWVWRFEGC